MGIFSSIATMRKWFYDPKKKSHRKNEMKEELQPSELRYMEASAVLLDHGNRTVRRWVFNHDGSLRGRINCVGLEKPWAGRPREQRAYQPGTIVGYVINETYLIGIIKSGPVDPEYAKRVSGVERYDDIYHVQTVPIERPYDPDGNDHDHIEEPRLFPVTHEIPKDLREALLERLRLGGGIED
jgi:hypothetical protein